jgi:hypothetical protein
MEVHSDTPGWHVTIYPKWFEFIGVLLRAAFLSSVCFVICTHLKDSHRIKITLSYFIILFLLLSLFTLINPYPFSDLGSEQAFTEQMERFNLLYRVKYTALIAIHPVLIIYFAVRITKRKTPDPLENKLN